MVACGAAWDVLYVDSLTGVQFADPRMSGLITGLPQSRAPQARPFRWA
jgi:hypothetical protein